MMHRAAAAAVVVLWAALTVIDAQEQGTLLALPELEHCQTRPKHFQFNNHWYYFSWDVPSNIETDPTTGQPAGIKVNWLEARNECRRQCMDAVGIETFQENNMILQFIESRNVTYIWTSGRLCDFTGCDSREDLKPIQVKGWFWSNSNQKIAPTNRTPPGWRNTPWSQKGHFGGGQPDNAEFQINNTTESCLGVLNNIYNDGIKWHDIACYHKKPYICEDSDLLIEYIEAVHSVKL
uniref:C-type lectin n=1 Tax=Hirondellea gigas TaxID=1518452 RepID=A0A6A7FTG8_9CRUS